MVLTVEVRFFEASEKRVDRSRGVGRGDFSLLFEETSVYARYVILQGFQDTDNTTPTCSRALPLSVG